MSVVPFFVCHVSDSVERDVPHVSANRNPIFRQRLMLDQLFFRKVCRCQWHLPVVSCILRELHRRHVDRLHHMYPRS